MGKRSGSAQAASSRLLFRVIQRVRELQHIAARNAAETAEKMARELNEIQYEARADKAHAAAVSAIATKAKIDFNQANSMADIGRKLLQSVGFASSDDVSVQEAIELNNVFVAQLEAIRGRAQRLTIE